MAPATRRGGRRRCSRRRRAHGVPRDLPLRRHEPLRPGRHRRRPRRHPPALPRHRGARRRRRGCAPARVRRCGRSTPASPATGASSGPTRPARSPAPSAASSPTTPAAWRAAPTRTPTARSSRPCSCCRAARSSTPRAPDADERAAARRAGAARRAAAAARPRARRPAVGRDASPTLFSIKNTMGYGVNSFLDHDAAGRHPRAPGRRQRGHARVRRRGDLPHRAAQAARSPPGCWSSPTSPPRPPRCRRSSPPASRPSSCSTPRASASPSATRRRPTTCCALDVRRARRAARRVPGGDRGGTRRRGSRRRPRCSRGLPLAAPGALSTDAARRAALWHIRKGLYTAVAGARPSGTTALLEDIAVPVDRLLDTCTRAHPAVRRSTATRTA